MTKRNRSKSIAVIGGGICGLSCGYYLTKAGFKVSVFEKDESLGGLISTFSPGKNLKLEKLYHHVFVNDKEAINLFKELGIANSLEPRQSKVGFLKDGKFYDFNKSIDFFSLPFLNFSSKIRFAFAGIFLKFLPEKLIKNLTAEKILILTMGKKNYRVIWEPLLKGKFGRFKNMISATWIVYRFKKRSGTRKKGREILLYPTASFQILIDALKNEINEKNIFTKTKIENIKESYDGYIINNKKYDILVSTIAETDRTQIFGKSNIKDILDLRKMTHLSKPKKGEIKSLFSTGSIFLDTLTGEKGISAALFGLGGVVGLRKFSIDYLGAICPVFFFKKPLTQYYWTNILDNLPFGGIIEHTNLIKNVDYGSSIVYLSHYLENSDPLFKMSDNELESYYLRHLKKIFPDIENNLKGSKIYRVSNAQPIIKKGFKKPAVTTNNKLYVTSMTHTYPFDRGINYAIKEARNIANEIIKTHLRL